MRGRTALRTFAWAKGATRSPLSSEGRRIRGEGKTKKWGPLKKKRKEATKENPHSTGSYFAEGMLESLEKGGRPREKKKNYVTTEKKKAQTSVTESERRGIVVRGHREKDG